MVQSLCNACGIRQRKARRAMMASGGGSGPVPADGAKAATATPRDAMAARGHSKVKKEKRVDVERSLPFKKRCKMVAVDHAVTAAKETPTVAAPSNQDQDLDHVSSDKVVSLQSKVVATPDPPAMSFHAFPADEITDAAMLLMTLSCGLVRS